MNWIIVMIGALAALIGFMLVRDLDRAAKGIRLLAFTLPDGETLHGDCVGIPCIGGTVVVGGKSYTVTAVTWTVGRGDVVITLDGAHE